MPFFDRLWAIPETLILWVESNTRRSAQSGDQNRYKEHNRYPSQRQSCREDFWCRGAELVGIEYQGPAASSGGVHLSMATDAQCRFLTESSPRRAAKFFVVNLQVRHRSPGCHLQPLRCRGCCRRLWCDAGPSRKNTAGDSRSVSGRSSTGGFADDRVRTSEAEG